MTERPTKIYIVMKTVGRVDALEYDAVFDETDGSAKITHWDHSLPKGRFILDKEKAIDKARKIAKKKIEKFEEDIKYLQQQLREWQECYDDPVKPVKPVKGDD